MKKVILFIAMSLDGYIADSHGGVDWLGGEISDSDDMVSYNEFIKGIDTVIMGAKTYNQITGELLSGDWAYKGMTSYVITHKPGKATEEIKFTNENPEELINRLKSEQGGNIWICGGAEIVNQLIKSDLIDRYHISVIPTILGEGIPLFNKTGREIKLKLVKSQNYNGITDLIYERR